MLYNVMDQIVSYYDAGTRAKGMSAEVCVSDTGLVQLSGNPRSDKKPPRE